MAWGARVALRRPPRNRLKLGARREGTVSDDILEARRLTRTDGGDLAYICLVARRVSFLGIKRDPSARSATGPVGQTARIRLKIGVR